MFKKKLFLVEILILFSVFISFVNSYTIARSDNSAEMKISSSIDALIAVPDDLIIKIQKPVQESQISGGDSFISDARIIENNFSITNNIDKTVQVRINSEYDHISFDDLTIFSGETIQVNVKIDDYTEPGTANIVIIAGWDDGNATIEKMLKIEVV